MLKYDETFPLVWASHWFEGKRTSKTKQINTYSSLADITPNDDETSNVLTITNIAKKLILVFSVTLHGAKSSHIRPSKMQLVVIGRY